LSFVTLGITNFLAPMGELRLENNRNEIRSELANALIREGRFLHPTDGLTVFIREASETGNMAGLFLHDERDPARPVTYTAERALLLRDGPIARLIMSRGVALTFSAGNDLLARVQFDEFTYDLSDLVSTVDTEPAKASTLMTWQLISPDASVEALARFKRGAFMATGHERIVFGVHALLMPLLALGVMLTGGYQRRGFSKRIIAAVLSGVTLVVAGLVVKGAVISNPGLWPVSYLPDVIAAGLIVFLLNRATTTRGSAAPA
ncbi:MAG: LptF/LptG family permease, partial [Pseudomonadota bacterium]